MHHRYIGDKAFYRRVFGVAVPIIIQNGITNFVSLLDNIMVGQVGTVPMSGVSIVNGLLFVFNLCVFGASSGAGIFTAQFYGSKDDEGIRHTFRFKFLICIVISLVGAAIFLLGGSSLIGLYLTGEGDAATAAGALDHGLKYLAIMLWGFLPFALTNTYSSTLRETGETFIPMLGGIAAVFVNLVLNYILIFGKFGAPEMGVEGAAIATVISRYVELAIVAGWTHNHKARNAFIVGDSRYMYICSTLFNLGSVVYLSMGNSVGIIMGQMLGAGHSEEDVRDTNRKLIAVSIASGVMFGGLMAAVSEAFPGIYNTTDAVRHLAAQLIWISAVMMPFGSYLNATYFTLRSGGQTFVTFLFDSCFMWVFCVPLAFCLSRFTNLPILPLYAICQATDFIKCVIGTVMLKQGKWIQNLTV